jgi:hypothetical protein
LCGSSADSACNDPDTCDGFGNCQANLLDVNTPCGTDPGECMEPPRCNAAGLCLVARFSPPSTPCGDDSTSECDDADVCDAIGNCTDNHAEGGTLCGDEASGECDVDDECNDDGQCVDLVVTPGTACGVTGNECVREGQCGSTGACVGSMNEPPGTPCGSASTSECDLADSCNGSGVCRTNYVDEGETCGAPPPECGLPSTCSGAGACLPGGVEQDCDAELTVTVRDQITSLPLAGLEVEVVGASPAESGVTDANGEVTLTVPVGEQAFLLQVEPSATHWGLRTPWAVAQLDPPPTAPLTVLDNDTVDARYAASGVATIGANTGIFEQLFFTANPNGGESATITPSCAEASCGPIAPDGSGDYALSTTTRAGAAFPPKLSYINLAAGNRTLTVSGVPGTNTCTRFDTGSSVAIIARTITQSVATCQMTP